MTSEQFEKMKGRKPYQVFLFTTHIGFPLSFATHAWFVTVVDGTPCRFEVICVLDKKDPRYLHDSFIYKDFSEPWQGFPIFFQHKNAPHFDSKLIGLLEGEEESPAQKFTEHILENYKTYPYEHIFSYYPGPNSNTYIQWLIDTGPENHFSLPWNAFGKGFEVLPEAKSEEQIQELHY
jgi:hypothetical protein